MKSSMNGDYIRAKKKPKPKKQHPNPHSPPPPTPPPKKIKTLKPEMEDLNLGIPDT